eukprot:gene6887-58172_t
MECLVPMLQRYVHAGSHLDDEFLSGRQKRLALRFLVCWAAFSFFSAYSALRHSPPGYS